MNIPEGYKLAFETQEYKGYKLTALWPTNKGDGDALCELAKGEEVIREFKYPAYKVYNLAAHFYDIVESELEQTTTGYEIAGSDGLGGVVLPEPIE
jgi:hypothetical protein